MYFKHFLLTNLYYKKQMAEKKQNNFVSPDLSKLQVVIIDPRTKIYIPIGANPEEARTRYFSRFEIKKT